MVGHIGSGCGRRVLLCCRTGHLAKAGAEAKRSALRGAAARAQAALTKSEGELAKARAEANALRALKQCGSVRRTKLAAEATAIADVEAARRELLLAEKTTTTSSPVALPTALDLVAYMVIWTGFSGRRSGQAHTPQGQALGRRAQAKAKPKLHS